MGSYFGVIFGLFEEHPIAPAFEFLIVIQKYKIQHCLDVLINKI